MRSPIYKDGLILGGVLAATAILSNKVGRMASWIFGGLGLFTLYFFRDPERAIPSGESLVVSPADGKIIGVDSVDHAPFIEGPAKRVSIFLSLFDAHINRAPIDGKVVYRSYNPGDFLPAYAPKASLKNEQNSIGIEKDGVKILVRQIAGVIARRIVCWKDIGDTVARGERFGLIRFGSRAELFLPIDSTIEARVGQVVKGGSSVIARLN